MIAEPDAARAVLPALTLPPGTYNVTDGCPVTQATLNARLAAALGKNLHPLDDPYWGRRGVLFGHSRRITDGRFHDLVGWHAQVPRAAEDLADML
jgi:nucleoside-diphosphate-sugar epimerase